MSEHHITLWACGHLKTQCRCPGPKTKTILPESCPGCSAQMRAGSRNDLEAKVHGRSHNELVRLAAYLTQQHGAAPQGQEGAVDVAIRLLRQTADLERTLATAQKALERKQRDLDTTHELHGSALQALCAVAAALAPNITAEPVDPLRLACRVIESARREHRSAILRDRAHLRGMLLGIPGEENRSLAAAIESVFERAAKLDAMGEQVLAGTTATHLSGCSDQPRVEYSRIEARYYLPDEPVPISQRLADQLADNHELAERRAADKEQP